MRSVKEVGLFCLLAQSQTAKASYVPDANSVLIRRFVESALADESGITGVNNNFNHLVVQKILEKANSGNGTIPDTVVQWITNLLKPDITARSSLCATTGWFTKISYFKAEQPVFFLHNNVISGSKLQCVQKFVSDYLNLVIFG